MKMGWFIHSSVSVTWWPYLSQSLWGLNMEKQRTIQISTVICPVLSYAVKFKNKVRRKSNRNFGRESNRHTVVKEESDMVQTIPFPWLTSCIILSP